MDWWCELFGYFNCRSIPANEVFIFWGGMAAAAPMILAVLLTWVLD